MRDSRAALLCLALLASSAALAQRDEEYIDDPVAEDGTLVYNFAQHPVTPIADGMVSVSAETNTVATTWGYTPVRVLLENKSAQAQEVRLEFVSSQGGISVRRTVQVPAARRATAILLIPAGANYGQLIATSEAFKDGMGKHSMYFQNATHAILALGADAQFQDAARRPPELSSYTTLVRMLDAADAPGELAAYVGFAEVVVLTPYEELTEAARRALEGYAATGGTLILTQPPRNVATYLPLLKGSGEALYDYGFGHVRLCGQDANACATGLAQDLYLSEHVVRPNISTGGSSAARYAKNVYGQNNGVPDSERFLLPQAAAPVGRFLLIILAFTLAIGPGSVWVARKRGPPMLLLTIPATAAVTCLLIVGYSVIVDGFAVHASTRGYTLLDAKNKRAITVGVAAFYANIAPGDAEFDTSTAILGPPQSYGAAQLSSVDWTSGARFDSEFVPSRTYREWGVVSVAPTRARLLARPSDDGNGVVVENALGADIRKVRVRMNGRDYEASDLRDGGQKVAVQVSSAPGPWGDVAAFASRFSDRTALRGGAVSEGQFLAQVEGPAFLPTGGFRLSRYSTEHVVRGEVER